MRIGLILFLLIVLIGHAEKMLANAFKRFGSKRFFCPFGSIDYYWQPLDCLSQKRLISNIVGSLHKNKIILSKIYPTGKIKIYGKSTIKQNLYFILNLNLYSQSRNCRLIK